MWKFLLVIGILILPVGVSAQVADTILLANNYKIRILRSGDTVKISNKQLSGVIDLFSSYERSIAGCKEESSMLVYANGICDSMLVASQSILSAKERHLQVCLDEYEVLKGVTEHNGNLLIDCIKRDKRRNRTKIWKWIGGGLIGFGAGALFGVIIK
jgi:hypothetical protein